MAGFAAAVDEATAGTVSADPDNGVRPDGAEPGERPFRASREETIAHLRRRMAAVPSGVDSAEGRAPVAPHRNPASPRQTPPRQTSAVRGSPAPIRAVPASEEPRARPDVGDGRSAPATPAPRASAAGDLLVSLPGLAEVLPAGGVTRGSVTAVTGSRTLLLGLLAQTTAQGGYAAMVGQHGPGLLAAVEMGADLSRIALVPEPGPDRVGVAAVLLDGMDLVVLDLGGASVPPSRSRAVVARARSRGAALVVTGGEWEGAEVRIDARVSGYEGLGAGCGRVHGMRMDVRARGRAFPSRGVGMVVRHRCGRMDWSAGPEAVRAGEARPAPVAARPGEDRRGA